MFVARCRMNSACGGGSGGGKANRVQPNVLFVRCFLRPNDADGDGDDDGERTNERMNTNVLVLQQQQYIKPKFIIRINERIRFIIII